MLDPIFDLITAVLAGFYQLWPSYGMAIVFLTLVVMVVTTPLTMKSTRAMMKMQLLAPELKKIQKKYLHDRVEMNKAQMEFYKNNDLNPMGGCLPVLIQGPVFLVLYRVVMGLTRRSTEIGAQIGFTSSRFAVSGLAGEFQQHGTPQDNLTFDPDFLSNSTKLYTDLSVETEMVSWGVDLSRSASTAMSEGFIEVIPYLAMILLVLVASLYQHHQIQKRRVHTSINPMQQTLMKIIPYSLPVISYGIPAAVVVYFIVSALCRIGQQYYIGRSFYSGEESLGAQLAHQRKSPTKTGSTGVSPKRSKTHKSSKSGTLKRDTTDSKRGTLKAAGKQLGQANKKVVAPVRPSRSGNLERRVSGAGRSGKAPVRASRGSTASGRVTSPGTKAKHAQPNRSKKKRKRR